VQETLERIERLKAQDKQAVLDLLNEILKLDRDQKKEYSPAR